jgi:hypothetical protein
VGLILASTPSRDRHYTLRVKKTYPAIDGRNIECQTFEIHEISTVIELLNEALEYVRETDPAAGPQIFNGKTD